MTIPGIGPLAATALLAAAGRPGSSERRAIWPLGSVLCRREYSTGGKTKLLGISKRGNRYLRRLIIHGARSCVTHLDRSRDRLGAWLDGLQARMHPNKVTVALAAKMARIVWVVMTKPGATYERRDPAFSLIPFVPDCEVRESDDETVDRRAVSPVQKSGLRARTIYWERRVRISSWPGCNSSPLARGRIHLCRLNRL